MDAAEEDRLYVIETLANDPDPNPMHYDFIESVTTSSSNTTSSVQNSPRSISTPNLDDERNFSIEVIEDLANNNDPNNNASDEAPLIVQHESNSQDEIETSDPVVCDADPVFLDADEVIRDVDLRDVDQVIFDVDPRLFDDIRMIRALLPDKTDEQIRARLEEYSEHPKRLKIVLNNLLEEQQEEENSKKKSKTGNGLKCKNRPLNDKPAVDMLKETNLGSNAAPQHGGTLFGLDYPVPSFVPNVSNGNPFLFTNSKPGPSKRKLPPPSSTITSAMEAAQNNPDEPVAGPSGAQTLMTDYDIEPKRFRPNFAATSSTADSAEPTRHKIEIGAEHLYGPFNFSEHRPEAKKSSRPIGGARKRPYFDYLEQSKSANSPPVITITDRPLTPTVVDLCQPDAQDLQRVKISVEVLTNELCEMFPDTPRIFLADQAEDLVGKPVALDRFIGEHLNRDGAVPEGWVPRERLAESFNNIPAGNSSEVLVLDQTPNPQPATDDTVTLDDEVPNPVGAAEDDHEEDINKTQLDHLLTIFPNTDPVFLHEKVVQFTGNDQEFYNWINETLENSASGLPTRKDYEKRQKEAEMLEKYSGQVTVSEILEMYDNDPESFFMDKSRTPTELYKRHAQSQLKKEFRQISVVVINKVFAANNGLFLPTYRELSHYHGPKRKSKRPDHEAPMPSEIDINFLKELQYARKEKEIRQHLAAMEVERQTKLEDAKNNGLLKECECCSNEECLEEDMLPCSGGHVYCRECIQRASAVAIGDGKTELKCLTRCELPFSLQILKQALRANTFSKWLEKIQLAEIVKAGVEGLEQCPYCPFATIMDEPKEANKVFTCLNPECGKESCRLCKEMSHIPLRCEEVEKDDEVRKRTYIENKMAEALIRLCYKCKRPFVKQDGCNKITCSNCGAFMCYICRAPVKGYDHFAGQGSEHKGDKCPLWSDNNSVHDRDVALGALEAKQEIEKTQPDVVLKHDPTAGINLELLKKESHAKKRPQTHDFPPGLEGILPQDPFELERWLAEQRRLERVYFPRRQGNVRGAEENPADPYDVLFPHHNHGLLHRMGELLRGREMQRNFERDLRRRELEALQEVRLHEIGIQEFLQQPPPPPPMLDIGQNFPFMGPHAGRREMNDFRGLYRPPPAHRQCAPMAMPIPPAAHPGPPRPAHVVPQPPPLPLVRNPDLRNHNHLMPRVLLEPIRLQRNDPARGWHLMPQNHPYQPPNHLNHPPNHPNQPPNPLNQPPNPLNQPPNHPNQPPNLLNQPPNPINQPPNPRNQPPNHPNLPAINPNFPPNFQPFPNQPQHNLPVPQRANGGRVSPDLVERALEMILRDFDHGGLQE